MRSRSLQAPITSSAARNLAAAAEPEAEAGSSVLYQTTCAPFSSANRPTSGWSAVPTIVRVAGSIGQMEKRTGDEVVALLPAVFFAGGRAENRECDDYT
jgi:hypothetical protein